MKHLLFGDIHMGLNIDNYVTKKGINSRFEEQKLVLTEILDYAIEKEIKHIIIKGDIFHYNKPMPVYIAHIIWWLKRAESVNIVVDILKGNHDHNQSNVSALEPIKKAFSDSEFIRVIDNEYITDEYGFIYVPFGVELPQEIKASTPQYLVCHAHIEGAVTGSESFMMSGGEDFIDKSIIGIKTIFSGHIHKPQSFVLGKIPVYYAGSITRIDAGEREDDKSFIIFDDEGDETNDIIRIPIKNAVEYKHIEITDEEMDHGGGEFLNGIDGKIVKIVINEYKGLHSLEQIEGMLGKALLVKSIIFNRAKQEVKRDKGALGLSPANAVKQFFKEHDNKSTLIKEGIKILEECVDG